MGLAGQGINTYDMDILENMAYVVGLRGQDGAGVFQVDIWAKKTIVLVEKDIAPISYFQWYHKYAKDGNRRVMSGVTNCMFAVHARAATRGALSKENSHPFEFSRYVGMHNGTLVDPKYKHESKTDSELLIEDINNRGLEVVLKELDPKSAYALVLFDKETNETIFVRNELRPFCFASHEKRNVIYWASEGWMIQAMAGRNGEKLHNNQVYHTRAGVIYRFKPNEVPTNREHLFRKTSLESGKQIVTVPQVTHPQPGPAAQLQQQVEQQLQKEVEVFQKGKEKVGPFPRILCPSCSEPVSLLDQYLGTKLSATVYLHKKCVNTFSASAVENRPDNIILQ